MSGNDGAPAQCEKAEAAAVLSAPSGVALPVGATVVIWAKAATGPRNRPGSEQRRGFIGKAGIVRLRPVGCNIGERR